jgi:cation transport ATPase
VLSTGPEPHLSTAAPVRKIALDGLSEPELLTIAASAEKFSEHPLARAVMREAEERSL